MQSGRGLLSQHAFGNSTRVRHAAATMTAAAASKSAHGFTLARSITKSKERKCIAIARLALLAGSSSPDVGLLVVAGGLGGTEHLGQRTLGVVAACGIADVEASGVATSHLAAEASHHAAHGAGSRHTDISPGDSAAQGSAVHHAQGTLEGGTAHGTCGGSNTTGKATWAAGRGVCCQHDPY